MADPALVEMALTTALEQALRSSNVPLRLASEIQPPFWAYPLTPTKIEPVQNGDWVTFLDLQGLPGFVYRVNKYVATVFGDASLSGVNFRLLLNGNFAPNISFASGIDLNKITPTTFPVVPQDTFFWIGEQDRLTLQVQNTNLFQQLVIAGFFGWRFPSRDTAQRDRIAIIDDDT